MIMGASNREHPEPRPGGYLVRTVPARAPANYDQSGVESRHARHGRLTGCYHGMPKREATLKPASRSSARPLVANSSAPAQLWRRMTAGKTASLTQLTPATCPMVAGGFVG